MADPDGLDDASATRPEGVEILDEDAQSEVEKQNKKMDRQLDQLAGAVAAMMLLYFKRVRAILLEYGRDATLSAGDRRAIETQLDGALEDVGLSQVLSDYADLFEPAATRAVGVYEHFGADGTLDSVDVDGLRTVVTNAVDGLEATIRDQLVSSALSAVISGSVAGLTVEQILDSVEKIKGSLKPDPIVRQADESLTAFVRTAVVAKAVAEGFEVFLFIGPIPGACPRCLALLLGNPHGIQAAYYLDEVEQFTKIVDPKITHPIWAGMHPNCRHWWLGLPNEVLRENGFRFRDGAKPDDASISEEAGKATARARKAINAMKKQAGR